MPGCPVTIGIAAFGPRAGQAILAGLAAAERIGAGAIAGFVSLAVLHADGRLGRAATQTHGTAGLGALPEAMLAAPVAALMSSAANRPEPLAQFVAGAGGVGLVTGHRFPNMPGRSGMPLNGEILACMEAGASPAASVAALLAENPELDAGAIAIGFDGRLGSADARRLARLEDRGSARLGSRRAGGLVAVRHNGIRPARGLALLVAEVALAAILGEDAPDGWIELRAGTPVLPAATDRIVIDEQGCATRLEVSGGLGEGTRHIGMGRGVPVFSGRSARGFSIDEPFLIVRDQRLISADGKKVKRVPLRSCAARAHRGQLTCRTRPRARAQDPSAPR